jgi:RNA-directed DNA polymerase
LLIDMLKRRLKGGEILELLEKVISCYHTIPGKGLPIGALPSQHFANFYLDCLDRYIMERLHAKAYVRYMDDSIWWCDSKKQAKSRLEHVMSYVEERLLLTIKRPAVLINKSKTGVTFCGFRILPGKITLSVRRRHRYSALRSKWENAYTLGLINEKTLQSAYSSVYAITAHADSREWRRKQLALYKPPDC